MKNMTIGLTLVSLMAAIACGGYLWGYHEGVNDHAVISGMSEANWSLAAARSLRYDEPRLALELLESNLLWVDSALRLDPESVPENERGNYLLVLDRLERYRAAYWSPLTD